MFVKYYKIYLYRHITKMATTCITCIKKSTLQSGLTTGFNSIDF